MCLTVTYLWCYLCCPRATAIKWVYCHYHNLLSYDFKLCPVLIQKTASRCRYPGSKHSMATGSVGLPSMLGLQGGGSVGECGRLSQPSWVLGHYNIAILPSLFIYLLLMCVGGSAIPGAVVGILVGGYCLRQFQLTRKGEELCCRSTNWQSRFTGWF